MADTSAPGGGLGYKPYVPADQILVEFTVRALILGLIMCVILGAANAYLGLKAGMTIAATYPAAVISMAVLRLLGGNILEENIARTVGSIGESIAAGAIFTIPAFVIAGVWENLEDHYWEATIIMLLGGFIGILFVTMLRRVLVEDVELPFPESRAAGEIHKAGRAGGTGCWPERRRCGFPRTRRCRSTLQPWPCRIWRPRSGTRDSGRGGGEPAIGC